MSHRRLRLPLVAALLGALALAACDEGPSVNEQYRAKSGIWTSIRDAGGSVPVVLDALPDTLVGDLEDELEALSTELGAVYAVGFPLQTVPDGRALALRIAYQPPEHLTALSMCQGAPIGRTDSKRRSVTIVAALCEDRRRLVAVRTVYTLSDHSAAKDEHRQLLRAVIRRLFDVPYASS